MTVPDRSHLELHPGPEYDEPAWPTNAPHSWTVDWQALVDDLALAAGIAWQTEPRRWIVTHRYAARTIADYYHAAILAGNLDVEAVDGELFALDAAIAGYPPRPVPTGPGVMPWLWLVVAAVVVAVAVAWFALNGGSPR